MALNMEFTLMMNLLKKQIVHDLLPQTKKIKVMKITEF